MKHVRAVRHIWSKCSSSEVLFLASVKCATHYSSRDGRVRGRDLRLMRGNNGDAFSYENIIFNNRVFNDLRQAGLCGAGDYAGNRHLAAECTATRPDRGVRSEARLEKAH